MSGGAVSEAPAAISEADAPVRTRGAADAVDAVDAADAVEDVVEHAAEDDAGNDIEDDVQDPAQVARRARWTAAGTGVLLTLAGFAAALLRLAASAPARVPAAYGAGAAVCACAALLGARGHTRRALWLLIAGVMVMALGDQFD
ncbi:hypothetical protein [Streptomyces mexicanus]|uniref:Uncharacterized protein n=1 Tax=Streptomyces mexicanus TaxID=178566 RepID=A0A7X1LSB7_9ACTN|nr:hypothetical protein [Streptomyces mexicanus]MBC2867517.1 hypothetical protein [Streptomyces mexicanus]